MQMKNVCETKKFLRSLFKNKRLAFTPEQKAGYDKIILKKIRNMYNYKNASVILTYVSKDIEVDTIKFIEMAFADGKRVAVPKCIDGTRKMDFYFINSFDDLDKGTFGVLEPKPDVCKKLTDFSEGFCIVPGMSFDTNGFRLGYGKGYYDRFLSKFKGSTAGICYSSCVKWNLPRGKFDRAVDVLITEKYVRFIKRSRSVST